MSIVQLKNELKKNIDKMIKQHVFRIEVDKDELWNIYLQSFPEGTNPIYKERTEHDCNTCKQFVRNAGNMVTIKDNKLVTIWDDIHLDNEYKVVSDKLSEYVKTKDIGNIFLSKEANLGSDYNHQQLENGKVIKWEHLYYKLPSVLVNTTTIDTKLGNAKITKTLFNRGLDEITIEALEIVDDLITQNSIYRGVEFKNLIKEFKKLKKNYDKVENKDIFCWENSIKNEAIARIRNTVIGTLLQDISNGKSLEDAVRKYESKVAPQNYKRSSALITKSMVKNAEKKVHELGLDDALERRYATEEDITVNNVLSSNKSIKRNLNVFDDLIDNVPDKVKINKVEEVNIETFINNIIPKAESLEVFVENKHVNNFMSLIAPVHPDSRKLFKWDNNFSWTYNGEVTDSIKERVKKAGGNVSGILRCSLSWYNYDDLDIHVIEPSGNHIYYRSKNNLDTTGQLDIDMNAGSRKSREPVENITWTNKAKMLKGKYKVFVNNYNKRETIDEGFDVELEYDGELFHFHYNKSVKNKENVKVVEFSYDPVKGIEFIKSLPKTSKNREVWNITTNKFHKVKMSMLSPNHWDDMKIGNKHYFFILNNCKNDDTARGFYNEFLRDDLKEHRKVFEVLGNKMKAEYSENQLSGLGFSETQENSFIVKVTGSFNRTLKVNIK